MLIELTDDSFQNFNLPDLFIIEDNKITLKKIIDKTKTIRASNVITYFLDNHKLEILKYILEVLKLKETYEIQSYHNPKEKDNYRISVYIKQYKSDYGIEISFDREEFLLLRTGMPKTIRSAVNSFNKKLKERTDYNVTMSNANKIVKDIVQSFKQKIKELEAEYNPNYSKNVPSGGRHLWSSSHSENNAIKYIKEDNSVEFKLYSDVKISTSLLECQFTFWFEDHKDNRNKITFGETVSLKTNSIPTKALDSFIEKLRREIDLLKESRDILQLYYTRLIAYSIKKED